MVVCVMIEFYSVDWVVVFQQEQGCLEFCFIVWLFEVQYIGSIVVEGLGGKFVIDIMVGFLDEESLSVVVDLFLKVGYCYYFCFEEFFFCDWCFLAWLQDFLVIVFESLEDFFDWVVYLFVFYFYLLWYGFFFWKWYLAFCDYLWWYLIMCDVYYCMKVKLAKGVWESYNDYVKVKIVFICWVECLVELEG